MRTMSVTKVALTSSFADLPVTGAVCETWSKILSLIFRARRSRREKIVSKLIRLLFEPSTQNFMADIRRAIRRAISMSVQTSRTGLAGILNGLGFVFRSYVSGHIVAAHPMSMSQPRDIDFAQKIKRQNSGERRIPSILQLSLRCVLCRTVRKWKGRYAYETPCFHCGVECPKGYLVALDEFPAANSSRTNLIAQGKF